MQQSRRDALALDETGSPGVGERMYRSRAGRLLPLLVLALSVGVAALFVGHHNRSVAAMRRRIHCEQEVRMAGTLEHVEEYFSRISADILFITMDPHVRDMSDGSRGFIQGLFDHERESKRLTEIYVLKRDFDGARRPFMTFEQGASSGSTQEAHAPEREQEEYRALVEQMVRFDDDPTLRAQISPELTLCQGFSAEGPLTSDTRALGVVYSVPVRREGELRGIVAAMVPTSNIQAELARGNYLNMAVLANESGDIYSCADLPEDTRAWFETEFQRKGVSGFYETAAAVFDVGRWKALWTPVEIASGQRWWLAFLYDETATLEEAGISHFRGGWGGAAGILVLGAVVAGLLKVGFGRLEDRISFLRERRRAREALQESEEHYRELVEGAENLVTQVDSEGKFTFVNDMAEKVFGLRPDECVGLSAFDFVHPDDRERTREAFDGWRRNLPPSTSIENRQVSRSGEIRHMLWTSSIRVDADGKVSSINGIARDITERKRAEDALRESEERYRSLFEESPVSLWEEDFSDVKIYIEGLRDSGVKDLRGYLENHPEAVARCAALVKVVGVNRATLELYDAGTVEAFRDGLGTVFGEESCNVFREELVALADGDTRFESEAVTRTLKGDKNHIVLRWSVATGYEETVSKVLVSIMDITERKRAEKALRESEERYRLLFDTVSDGIMLFDAETREFLDVNATALAMYGYTKDEFLKLSHGEITAQPEDSDRSIRETAKNGADKIPLRLHRKKDGTVFPVEISGSSFTLGVRDVLCGVVRDITERKRAEDALRDSGRSIEESQQLAHIGSWSWAVETDTVRWSEELYRITQRDPQLPPPTYAEHSALYTAESWEKLSRSVERAVNEGISYELELDMVRPDGQVRSTSTLGEAVKDKSGRTVRLHGTVQDITERKRAEEAVRHERDRAEAYLDLAGVMFVALNARGEIILLNRKACEVLGCEADQALGKRWFDAFLPKEQREEIRTVFARLMAGDLEPVKRLENAVVTTDGRKRVIAWHNSLLRNDQGAIVGTLSSGEDITERRRTEEALRESEERHRLLFESSRDAIMTLAPPSWRFTSGNAAAIEILGAQDEADFVSRAPWEYSPPSQPDGLPSQGKAKEMIETAMQEGSHFFGWRHKRLDGQEFPATVLLTRFELAGQALLQATVRDVSSERQLEEQLAQAQKMESVGKLAGGVAHDFNNILQAILGYADIALMEPTADRFPYEELVQIRDASERAAALVRQLMAFSRKQLLQMKVIDLGEVVGGIQKMLRRTIREDIELEIRVASATGKVNADVGQVEQILMNLAVNAQDAMPDGGTLAIETAEVFLDEAYASAHTGMNPGPHAMVSVTDTGEGMDEETLDRIFEPFFTTKEVGKGTGLGLSTVYGIVKQHGGSVWAYSKVGKGTTFKIYFPRAEAKGQDSAAEEARATDGIPRGSETVLVAEDDQTVRALTCAILTRKGYDVIEAADPEEAMRLVKGREGAVDLLLTDIVMPGMNGRELYERLRSVLPDLKVLYMSGYTDNAIGHHGFVDRDVDFIQKPVTAAGLAAKVRDVLDA